MDKRKSSHAPFKIDSDEDLGKFLEENKDKIPKGVKVERVSSINESRINAEDGVVIHAHTFSLGLYLPFHPLIREILSRLGLVPTQLAPNCWRIMCGIIALNRIYEINLGWNEFCHCYAVKQNSAGTYYFSHRETATVLVTDLPKSEKARKDDDLIFVTGDWEKGPGDTDTLDYLVPRTKAAAHKPTGLKPRDRDVNHSDMKQALALSYGKRNWRYLCDHPSYLELQRESKIADESQPFPLTAPCSANNSLQIHGQTSRKEVVDATDVLSSPASSYKKQKLRHSESTSSTAAKSIEDTSDLSSTGSLIDDFLDERDYENVESEMEVLFEKAFKFCDIIRFFKNRMTSFLNRIKRQDDDIEDQEITIAALKNTIEELKVTIERKDKDFEELKLTRKEEHVTPVRAETTGATNKESLKRSCEENENFKKVNEHIKGLEKIVEKLQADMRQMKEDKRSQLHTRKSSLSSPKNAEPLTGQNENDIIEGAAAVPAPNIMAGSYWDGLLRIQ